MIENAMPQEFAADMGQWLDAHRMEFVRGGDPDGLARFNWELTNVDQVCDLLSPFRKRLVEALPDALEPCGADDFDLEHIEINATLYHHGSHFVWHDDTPGYDGEPVRSRRVSYTYYMHAQTKMFRGGELEFTDGTQIEPKHNRLCLFNPYQQHRIRTVECWSAYVLHGRWALMGWFHAKPESASRSCDTDGSSPSQSPRP